MTTDKKILTHPENSNQIRHEDFIAGISKGLAVLDCFNAERHRLNTTMVAKWTGMTRAAARRHLLTLEYLGYLVLDGHYYELTPKVLKLSGSYLDGAQLPKIAQPLLNMLTMQTELIYSVMVLDGYEVITIARSTPHQSTYRVNPYGLHLGNRLPAHATSAGKVLLSQLDSESRMHWLKTFQLRRLTKYTPTETDKFLQILDEVQAQEWCYASEEHELGVHALAVPVYGRDAKVSAALNVVSPSYRTTEQQLMQEILPLLKDTASEFRNLL